MTATVPTTRILQFQRHAVQVKAQIPADAMRPVFDRIATAYEVIVSRRFGITLADLAYEVREECGECCTRTARRIVYMLWRMGLVEKQVYHRPDGSKKTTWALKPLLWSDEVKGGAL